MRLLSATAVVVGVLTICLTAVGVWADAVKKCNTFAKAIPDPTMWPDFWGWTNHPDWSGLDVSEWVPYDPTDPWYGITCETLVCPQGCDKKSVQFDVPPDLTFQNNYCGCPDGAIDLEEVGYTPQAGVIQVPCHIYALEKFNPAPGGGGLWSFESYHCSGECLPAQRCDVETTGGASNQQHVVYFHIECNCQ